VTFLTYRYRLKDRTGRKLLRQQAWACNQVWNWCVAQQRDTEGRYILRLGRGVAPPVEGSRECPMSGNRIGTISLIGTHLNQRGIT